jgi:hypothetical protein
MLSLYETTMSPGTAVVKLLTGRRPLEPSNHSAGRSTQSQLLYLVEPVDELAARSGEERGADHDLQVA